MSKKKGVMHDLKTLFDGVELVAIILITFIISTVYLSYLTNNVIYSIIMSVVLTAFLLFVFIVPNRKLRRYQGNLQDLLKYVTNMIFFLQTGSNVLSALENVKKTVGEDVKKDIEKTIRKLKEGAELDTSHFKKYEFPALDQFHQNLFIKYEQGGDAKDLFSQIQGNMVFELKKRDELRKKRTGLALNIYILLGLVWLMGLILRLVVTDLWFIFLEYQLASLGIITVTMLLIMFTMRQTQKHALDISVRI